MFAAGVGRGLALTTWGFVIAGQFNTVAYYPFLWINLALTVSLAGIVRKAGQRPRRPASRRPDDPDDQDSAHHIG